MSRYIIVLLLCSVMMITFSGCYDAKDITDYTYVTIIGVDKGISDKWRITFHIRPNIQEEPKGGSTTNSGNDGTKFRDLIIDSPSFYAGVELANTIIPRELNFSHTQLIVVSQELAESGLMGEFIAPIVRDEEIRFSTYIMISKGSAQKFVTSFQPFAGTDISKTTNNLLKEAQEIGYSSKLELYDLYDCMKSTYHQPIALYGALNKGENFKEKGNKWSTKYNIPADYYAGEIPRKQGNEIELLGVAVFNGDKMVGRLTGHETRALNIVKGKLKKGIVTVQDPKEPELIIPVRIKYIKKPKVKVEFEGSKPIIHIRIDLQGDIYAIQSRINYEDPKLQPLLNKAIEKHIMEVITKTIKKSQELNCDIFKFGHTAVKNIKKFKTIEDWEKYDWNKHYKDAEITANVNVDIKRTGKLIKSSPIIFSE